MEKKKIFSVQVKILISDSILILQQELWGKFSQLNSTAQTLHMRINYLEPGHVTHDISDFSQL